MKQYTDGKRVIYATEKAYEVLYKSQGFKPVEAVSEDVGSNKANPKPSNRRKG